MAAGRRARTMPKMDDLDRCQRGNCGKVIKKGEVRLFIDSQYDRTLRVGGCCAMRLRKTAGYKEIEQ